MNESKRLTIWLVLLLVLLVGIAVWSNGRMNGARAKAELATQNLEDSRRLITQIHALRDKRAIQDDRPERDREVVRLIEQSADETGIDRTSVTRISPETPQRLADTGYAEYRLLVELRHVNMDQFLRFLLSVADEGDGLNAKVIQLQTPQNPTSDSVWNADTTFYYIANISNQATTKP